jgi:hypothetical protein
MIPLGCRSAYFSRHLVERARGEIPQRSVRHLERCIFFLLGQVDMILITYATIWRILVEKFAAMSQRRGLEVYSSSLFMNAKGE